MKEAKLTVDINKPAKQVFDFVTNPNNTPKWIDAITAEVTSEWPIKIGTIYKNKSKEGEWSTYTMTEFKDGVRFVLSKGDGRYHVQYTLAPITNSSCRLEYYEWVDHGQLDEVFALYILEKLKTVVEVQ